MDIPHHDTPRALYRTEPHIRVIAVALPMLTDLAATLDNAGLTPERRITEGLVELLAELVLSGSVPDSEEYAAAEAALHEQVT